MPGTSNKVLGERAFALHRWFQDCLLSGVGQVVITLVAVPGDGFTTYLVFLLGRKAGAGDQGTSSVSLLCPHLSTEQ